MAMFLKMVGARAQHVPYCGSVPAFSDVISGHIPIMIVDLAVAIPAIDEGKVKALGVTSTSRIKAMTDIDHIVTPAGTAMAIEHLREPAFARRNGAAAHVLARSGALCLDLARQPAGRARRLGHATLFRRH